MAGVRARRRAGTALRLQGPRAVGSAVGGALQSGQAAARPVCARRRRRGPMASGGVGHVPDDPDRADGTDSAPYVPRSVVVAGEFDWGEDRPPALAMADSIFYEVHVKGFTKLHPDVPEELRGTYAGLAHPAAVEHLKRLGVTAVELLPVHQFVHDAALARARTAQRLGLSVDRVLRATQRLRLERRRRRPGRGVPSDGPRPACGRPRGDPRRGVQPHRGGERVGSDAVLPRDRQRRLLPARREPRAVRRRHRLRQHGRPAPASNAAAGDGRAPLLGGGHARRRLSVRSGGRARTRRQRLRPARLVPGVDRPGPGARRGEADRRAVGYRSLRRRTVPGRVERMEWEVSGHRA